MKVFLDTNIFIEYTTCRKQFRWVRDVFDAIEDGAELGKELLGLPGAVIGGIVGGVVGALGRVLSNIFA